MPTPTSSEASGPLAVETVGLTRAYDTLIAVADVNISIPKGSVFGLLGPNGAGKTTTIKMLTTLLHPSQGQARVAGFDVVRQAAQVRQYIGYVPQMLSADADLSGYENLLIFSKLYRIPAGERQQRIEETLSFMGLSEVARTLVRHYSGGMIRRLEIAQSLLHHPQVLFLDEPPWVLTRRLAMPSRNTCGPCGSAGGLRSFSPPITWRRPRSCVRLWLSCIKAGW